VQAVEQVAAADILAAEEVEARGEDETPIALHRPPSNDMEIHE